MSSQEIIAEKLTADLTAEAPADTLYEVGLAYSNGVGVDRDYEAAHKWFNLAAAKGSEAAKTLRQDLATHMSRAEISRAQKAARNWLKRH